MEYISSEKDMILTQPSWWDFLRVISTSVSWQENAGIGRLNLLKKKKKKNFWKTTLRIYCMLHHLIPGNPTKVKQRVLYACFNPE